MAQHKMKQKNSLPTGAKQKSVKRIQKSKAVKQPRKGSNIVIAPKKAKAVHEAHIGAEVSKIINEKNEEMVRKQSDRDVGKITTSKN